MLYYKKRISLTPKEASEYYNVSKQTLRRWETEGKIKAFKTEGGHRRYQKKEKPENKTGQKIIYTRVSSSKQKKDLSRQTNLLKKIYPGHKLITDVGSGLNYSRKGFKTILEQLFQNNISEVVVAYKDRWSRFGFEMFEWVFELHGAKLLVCKNKLKTPEQELAEDLMSITTVFTSRYYGSRKYKISKEISSVHKKNKNISK